MKGEKTRRHALGSCFLFLSIAATGCIPALHNRVSGAAIAPNRIVAVPPQVMVYTLDASDQRDTETESTGDLVDDVVPELNAAVTAGGGHVSTREQFLACGSPCGQFFRWGRVASLEIGLQREEIRTFGLHSVADWRFPRDIRPVRAAFGADFALFVVLKQARQTSGRKVLMALSGGYTVGKQIDVACIADLRDGRMTWCATERDDRGDLEDPGRISAIIKKLLQDIFAQPGPLGRS